MTILSKILKLGSSTNSDRELNRKIIATNLISVSTIILNSLFSIIVNFISFNWYIIIGLFGHSIILALTIFFNAKNKFKISRILILVGSLYFTNVLALLWGEDSFVEFILIPLTLLPFMMYKKIELVQKFVFILFLIIEWFILQQIYSLIEPVFKSGEHIHLIQSTFIFLAFSWTVIMLLIITNDSNQNNTP